MTRDEQRFMDQVSPEPNSGCWLWTGSLNGIGAGHGGGGYGHLRFRGKFRLAHRVSFELFKGAIPAGMHLDHLCRVRCCVNPDHLELVTPRENVLRGIGMTALCATKTHCKMGHGFTPDNTLSIKGAGRSCKICKAIRNATRDRRTDKGKPKRTWTPRKITVQIPQNNLK